MLSDKDANGHTTTYGYGDSYSDGVNRNTYAHVTSATNALGQTERWQWDFNAGKPTQATDLNGVNTTYSYDDQLDRLTTTVRAAGISGFQTQTAYSYQPYVSASTPFSVTTKQDQSLFQHGELQTVVKYDGCGREAETDLYETSSSYIAITTTYDALGRVATTTNPSRPGDGLNYPTTYSYDAVGRVLSVTTADGAVARTSYTGFYTTAIDRAGNSRVTATDGLGRLTSIWENPGGWNYQTSYGYDVLDDLTSVIQGSETRTFAYDSMKRLKQSVQPESGTTAYTYDAAGGVGGAAFGGGLGAYYGGRFGASFGSIVCASGGGSGGVGGGSSSGSGLSPKAKSKLGNLASRAGEKVRDVIRSRGGSGANVQRVGEWADRTLGEAAEAAVKGDPNAETAVKVAKQAGRLGQQY